MLVNGKEYTYSERTNKENEKFIDLLNEAELKLRNAINEITYKEFPTANQGLIGNLNDIKFQITKIEMDVYYSRRKLLKPVAVNEDSDEATHFVI